eukprot:GEMP01073793.1.p1 GENE.GEMP01073793.1~~GEMP01073793.1.p1  ORF type:complete len:230 (+),score=31.62 GEMP01073793.1:141-830(+)
MSVCSLCLPSGGLEKICGLNASATKKTASCRKMKTNYCDAFSKAQARESQMGLSVFSPDKLHVHVEPLSTNVTSMNFFNKLEEVGAISHSGHIRGRIEEMFEDLPIVNLIREAFFLEESELYDAFSDRDRRELLLRIFIHLNVGGASNQYEDHVEDYFKATKVVYKDLLSVRKNDSGDAEVISKVYSVLSLGPGGGLYQRNHISNFTYLVVDPMSRSIVVWRFQYRSIW